MSSIRLCVHLPSKHVGFCLEITDTGMYAGEGQATQISFTTWSDLPTKECPALFCSGSLSAFARPLLCWCLGFVKATSYMGHKLIFSTASWSESCTLFALEMTTVKLVMTRHHWDWLYVSLQYMTGVPHARSPGVEVHVISEHHQTLTIDL